MAASTERIHLTAIRTLARGVLFDPDKHWIGVWGAYTQL